MSHLYIQENLVRIQELVHKILCRQESVMQTPMPTLTPMGSALKSNVPLPIGWVTLKFFKMLIISLKGDIGD